MVAGVQHTLSQRVAHPAAVGSSSCPSAMQRRVDRSDPKDASAAQPLSIPPEWTLDSMSGYTVLLSAATYVYASYTRPMLTGRMALSMAVVSPYPDLSALGMLLACAQLVNQRPRSGKKDKDGGSNAISSFMYVAHRGAEMPADLSRLATAMSSSLAFTKVRGAGAARSRRSHSAARDDCTERAGTNLRSSPRPTQRTRHADRLRSTMEESQQWLLFRPPSPSALLHGPLARRRSGPIASHVIGTNRSGLCGDSLPGTLTSSPRHVAPTPQRPGRFSVPARIPQPPGCANMC